MINLTESIENRWGKNNTIRSFLPFSLRNGLKNSDLVKRAGIIVLLGLAYGCFADITGISVPCPVRYLTGVLCPGCGITTLFLSVAHGDLHSAKQANAFIFYTLASAYRFLLLWRDCITQQSLFFSQQIFNAVIFGCFACVWHLSKYLNLVFFGGKI